MPDIAEEASRAIEEVSALVEAVAGFEMPEPTNRALVAVKLARASVDYGIATFELFRRGYADYGAPAVSIHRTQIELVLRAAFFASSATEAELEYFLKKNRMPNGRRADTRKRTMSARELSSIVQPDFDPDSTGVVEKLVADVYPWLSGVVHGGRELLQLYSGHKIGFHLENNAMLQMIDHGVAFCHLATLVIAKISVASPEKFSQIMTPHFEAMQQRKARDKTTVKTGQVVK